MDMRDTSIMQSHIDKTKLETLWDVISSCDDASSKCLQEGSGGRSYSRRQVMGMAVRLGQILREEYGIQVGDVVTIVEANTVAFVIAFLGVTCGARAVAAPLNQNYTKDEFEYYMDDASSRLLIVGPSGNPNSEDSARLRSLPVFKLDPLKLMDEVQTNEESFDAIMDAFAHQVPHENDVALFLHTSGTTSRPKGVPLTHGNLAASVMNIVDTYEFTSTDVSLLVMPLFHVHGLMAGLLAPIAAGAVVVLPLEGRFSASTFWKDAVEYGVTYYTAVPTIHQILVSRAEKDYPKSHPPPLRVIRSCSASLAPATLKQVEDAFGAPVLEAYAMTEASHQMTSNPLPSKGIKKVGTVGLPQGSVTVTILNEKYEQVPPGEVGEVCIRGPNVTHGYKDNPNANKEAFLGGWFHTGDQGKLDVEGYLTLTGRIKELINRGGEKISPLEVDAILLQHPFVAQAASFGVPDEKFGESVAAAIVLNKDGAAAFDQGQDIEEKVKEDCKTQLAIFKIPEKIFIAQDLPKNATGKIQRKELVKIYSEKMPTTAGKPLGTNAAPIFSISKGIDLEMLPSDGSFLVAKALAKLGVPFVFGVPGIPVTRIASSLQACGIRYIACRNEQAASYAASAAGFLLQKPGVLVTVSGPGVIHALAGLSNSNVNGWPMLMLSGSCDRSQIGKGAFQELDQCKAVDQYVKASYQPDNLMELPKLIERAFGNALESRPGAVYVDLPSDILLDSSVSEEVTHEISDPSVSGVQPREADANLIEHAVSLIKLSKRPLIIVGKGAAYSRAETPIQELVERLNCPFISTSMGRGAVPDDHPLCANAARSAALSKADLAILFGARLNWQLHFGEFPKWSEDVSFIAVNISLSDMRCLRKQKDLLIDGDAQMVAHQLVAALSCDHQHQMSPDSDAWRSMLFQKASDARKKIRNRFEDEFISRSKLEYPLNHFIALYVIRNVLNDHIPAPVVVSEGANTMDQARLLLEPVKEPRTRLDAGTHGTMGVGPGFALAAACAWRDTRHVVAIEGDSAFGFSAMEVETSVRYGMPIIFIVFNNQGVYGGDRRDQETRELAENGLKVAGWNKDLSPTAFVPNARYDLMGKGFGCEAAHTRTAIELESALRTALSHKKTTVIDVAIDPSSGVESGNVHAFNQKK